MPRTYKFRTQETRAIQTAPRGPRSKATRLAISKTMTGRPKVCSVCQVKGHNNRRHRAVAK